MLRIKTLTCSTNTIRMILFSLSFRNGLIRLHPVPISRMTTNRLLRNKQGKTLRASLHDLDLLIAKVSPSYMTASWCMRLRESPEASVRHMSKSRPTTHMTPLMNAKM